MRSGYAWRVALRTLVIANSMFKIVKAHNFLGDRGGNTSSTDGRIVIFDEAQRTYQKGRLVLNKKLEDHEADLIRTNFFHARGEDDLHLSFGFVLRQSCLVSPP